MKNYRIIKGKKIHVNQLAANSRKFTVKNIKKGISPIVAHKRFGTEIPENKLITNPLTGNKFVMVNPHTITGNYGITVTGYDWVPVDEYKANTGLLWEHKKYPQPKSYWCEMIDGKPTMVKSTSLHKDPVKMNRVQYMEKLVEHKLAKWEKKNPQPCPNDDLFKVEHQAAWYEARDKALERFRDFAVSIYDKLPIMGNIVDKKNKKMKAIKIGEVRDVDGKGHNVDHPYLNTNDKLYKHAEAIAISAMKMDRRILDADLMNHKRNQKRPLNVIRQPIDIKKAA